MVLYDSSCGSVGDYNWGIGVAKMKCSDTPFSLLGLLIGCVGFFFVFRSFQKEKDKSVYEVEIWHQAKEYLEFILGQLSELEENYLSSYDGRIYYLLSWQDCRRYL